MLWYGELRNFKLKKGMSQPYMRLWIHIVKGCMRLFRPLYFVIHLFKSLFMNIFHIFFPSWIWDSSGKHTQFCVIATLKCIIICLVAEWIIIFIYCTENSPYHLGKFLHSVFSLVSARAESSGKAVVPCD